jgi:GNAT superfamily N-acetyltransferase
MFCDGMKMYFNYISERLGQDMVLYPETGFGTFEIQDRECYIVDIFVEKEFRKQNVATRIADDIVQIAKAKGCITLKGTVQTNTKNSETSEAVLQAYGMKLVGVIEQKNLKIYSKDI